MADRKKPSRDPTFPTSHTPHSPICTGEDGRPQKAGGERDAPRTQRAPHIRRHPHSPHTTHPAPPTTPLQVEKELAEVQPVLEAARAAVGGIKSDNLNEIKSLKMPPEPIRDVLEGVLRIMGNFDTSWISMKRFLGTMGTRLRRRAHTHSATAHPPLPTLQATAR